MPTYEYACNKCGLEFEVFQSMKDDALKTCNCGKKGKVTRKIGRGAGLIFKGNGFYETDYKRTAETKKAAAGENTAPVAPAAPSTTPAATSPAKADAASKPAKADSKAASKEKK
jgi:putative FmdB family regulatory protein